MARDRYIEICGALDSILKELAKSAITDQTKLGKMAVARLYDEFPNLSSEELEAVTETLPLNPLLRSH